MAKLTVDRVCDECGEKRPHEVKQILLAKQSIAEIEDLRLNIFSACTSLNEKVVLYSAVLL